jgi:hypothetical protein
VVTKQRKLVQLLSYEYPNHLMLLVKNRKYCYEASEFWCRKFMICLERGGQFNSLNWFKRVAKVVEEMRW